MLRLTSVAAVMMMFLLTGCSRGVSAVLATIQHADHYELLSLDPSDYAPPAPSNFHGWRVLGRTTINDATTQKTLNDVLRKAASENDGRGVKCFNPRHGIHVVRGGRSYDLVICFHCTSVEVFEGQQQSGTFLVSASAEPVFDKVLVAAGVPLASKAVPIPGLR